MNDLSTLDVFKMDATVPKSYISIKAVTPTYKFEGRILCFDQTLNFTGWSVLECRKGVVSCMETGDFKRDKAAPGFEGNFALSDQLAIDVHNLIRAKYLWLGVEQIVYEMPAVVGYRTDSSLMAATVISSQAAMHGFKHSRVNNQHTKKVLTGDPKATKGQVKKAVIERIPAMKHMQPINTNVTDSAALGLVWMMENTNED